MSLTIAYVTARRDCRFQWFAESLKRQVNGDWSEIKVVVVDFWSQEMSDWPLSEVGKRAYLFHETIPCLHTPPKPCVWSGPHRLTAKNYFTACNSRNTALCYAMGSHIAYVDDLSVLAPGWLDAAREAMKEGYIACGAFRKVNNMVVKDGLLESFDDHAVGHDSRWNNGVEGKAVDCPANWLFGCSAVLPIDALLKVNGWPEAVCDSTGIAGEDSLLGVVLKNTGHSFKYDRRLMTHEAEDLHQQVPVLARDDKGDIGTPNSKSHAAVRMLLHAKYCDNDFSPFPDLAALRQHILSGGQFPIPQNPRHCWYSSAALSEL